MEQGTAYANNAQREAVSKALLRASLEGLQQEYAAGRIKISRQTCVASANKASRTISDAPVNGKALKISGNLPGKYGPATQSG